MKTTILTNKFKKGLSIIERISTKNINLPILSNVLIQTEKNFLDLISTDLEIALKYWILAKNEIEGKITIPAKLLYNFISSLEENNLTLETKNNVLFIKTKNSLSKIIGQDPNEFPILPKFEKENFIEIKNSIFLEGISQVVDFTSITQIRPEISGVYFNFQTNSLKLVATDSFRLAEKKLDFKTNQKQSISKEYSFILPQKATKELNNILSEKNFSPDKKVKIYFSKNQILFEILMEEIDHPQIHLISRLIEGDYPNYQEIIPREYKTKITILKNKLLNQIKLASWFSGKINEIKIGAYPKNQTIEICSQSPEIGENKAVLAAKIEGKESKVSFNHRFIMDGIMKIKTKEITFELNGEEGPAVMRGVGDPSYLYVVMPIKTS